MIKNEISKSNLKMHQCRVEKVYPSGLIDVRSESDGSIHRQINVTFSGVEGGYRPGDKCLVISDGSQYFSIGRSREPSRDENGNITIRDTRNDLSDLEGANSVVSTDEFDTQSRVIVSRGGGVIVDGGESCISHWDPANNKIADYSERYEMISVPASIDLDHDGVSASTKVKLRSTYDPMSVDRDYDINPNDTLDLGQTINVEFNQSEGFKITAKITGGVEQAVINIDTSGNVNVQSSVGTVTVDGQAGVDVSSSLGDVTITSDTGDVSAIATVGQFEAGNTAAKIRVNSPTQLNTVFIGNQLGSLNLILDQLISNLKLAQTVTLLGPQPLLPFNPAVATAIEIIDNLTFE